MQANLNSGGSTAATSAGTGLSLTGAAATSDMFTKLLVAQIRNQDPLSPTDPSQFVNQLTQLSQTESLQALASQSTTNASLLQSLQALALGAQVGSGVSVATDHVSLDGNAVDGHFTLAGAAVQVLDVVQSTEPLRKVHEPGHPLADADGMVFYPNVNPVAEMTDMMSASRAFETSVEVLGRVNAMQQAVLKLGEA